MFVLFHHWKKSIFLLFPGNFSKIFFDFVERSWKTFVVVAKYFKWFFVIDFCILVLFGDKFIKSLQSTFLSSSPMSSFPMEVLFFSIVTGIIGFVLSVSFFILLPRKNYFVDVKFYMKTYFFRYVQITFFFMMLALFGIMLLVNFRLTIFPKFHFIFGLLAAIIHSLTTFYWLESKFYFRDIFRSFERAINLIMYNAPFFAVFLGSIFLGKLFLSYCLGLENIEKMLTNGLDSFLIISKQGKASWIILFFLRYIKFLLDALFFSFLFVIYNAKKKALYSKSIF
jgi:hypothetical protein